MPLIQESDLRENLTVNGYLSSYSLILEHSGLNEVRELKAKDYQLLLQKRNSLLVAWEKKWKRIQEKKDALAKTEARKQTAEDLTAQAQSRIEQMENILRHTLSVNDAVDWEKLKNKDPFNVSYPEKPDLLFVSDRPTEDDFKPKLNLLDRILPFLAKKKELKAIEDLHQAQIIWDDRTTKNIKMKEEYNRAIEEWEKAKKKNEDERSNYNEGIENLKAAYFQGSPDAICENCELILENSEYPDEFPKSFNLEYKSDTKILVLDYRLPSPDQIPTLKGVKFIATRSELQESHISEAQKNRIYDSVIYQIALRTIHELFEGDTVDALAAVSLNGIVQAVNKATGQMERNCILTIQAQKQQFEAINLEMVDPKACFKSLKGISSSKLYGITPVAPIMTIDKEDSRFIDGYAVAGDLDISSNLATMDWKDFEHLVRELFSQEFSANGGEVKITKASRDGGVDAVAFDPDPLRGGKIVIQAKRYTNTVGVSAVRDLFGTVQAEGANKGILVTTADYGPDSYAFAQGKPLTLIDGANLLSLLEKHGHRATINLKSAKKAKP